MGFLTAEEVRAVRLKDSVPYKLERLGKEIRIVLVSGSGAMALRALAQGADRDMRESFVTMIEGACATVDGDRLTRDDADALFALLPLDEVTQLLDAVSSRLSEQAKLGKAKASPGTSNTASASPSAGPTPTT